MARGADMMGYNWAKRVGLLVKEFPADWEQYGKAAGFVRNQDMADYADALLAFWDGASNGTRDMIHRMRGKPIHVELGMW